MREHNKICVQVACKEPKTVGFCLSFGSLPVAETRSPGYNRAVFADFLASDLAFSKLEIQEVNTSTSSEPGGTWIVRPLSYGQLVGSRGEFTSAVKKQSAKRRPHRVLLQFFRFCGHFLAVVFRGPNLEKR